jgi:uncharacterized membrane protein YfcA
VDSWPILAAIAAVFVAAGFVKGVVGMGLPTVAIGLLVLVLPPAKAAALLVIPSLMTNAWQAVAGRALVPLLIRLWPLLAGSCVGTIAGEIWLPESLKGNGATYLGFALVLYAALGLLNLQIDVPQRGERAWGLLAGLLNGVTTILTGVFFLSVPYIQGLHLKRDAFVQALGLSFTVSTVALGAALSYGGHIGAAVIGPSLLAVAGSVAGMLAGQAVRARISPRVFRLCFLLALLALGAHLALRGLL